MGALEGCESKLKDKRIAFNHCRAFIKLPSKEQRFGLTISKNLKIRQKQKNILLEKIKHFTGLEVVPLASKSSVFLK